MDAIRILESSDYPPLLKEINDPPKKLYIRGELPDITNSKILCVIGTRKISDYGKTVCEKLINGLSGFPIIIVSGLALGIDGVAHESAIKAGLKTIAIPGSGLGDAVLYPATNKNLAKKIISLHGCLLSEFEPDQKAAPYMFPQRNRIMAGLSHATLIIECTEKSGTLITARLAMEYNREVLTVPQSIFSENSRGPHYLIKNGATLIEKSGDILEALGFKVDGDSDQNIEALDLSREEKIIFDLLDSPRDKDELIHKSSLSISDFNTALTSLELKELVNESLGKIHRK